jgi:hypothetical protein
MKQNGDSRVAAGRANTYSAGLTALRYLQDAPIRVRGRVTGRTYAFSGVKPVKARLIK